MAHAQKPDLVFQRNGRVHLNRRGCQFSRLLAVKECGSADSNCIDRAPSSSSRLLAAHSIRIFPLHFPSRASPCAIRFRTRYTSEHGVSSIINADAQTSAASSRLNWRPRWFKWTRPFRRKTRSGFCACAITFQLTSNYLPLRYCYRSWCAGVCVRTNTKCTAEFSGMWPEIYREESTVAVTKTTLIERKLWCRKQLRCIN